MCPDRKIRVLVLDDDPKFIDSDTGLITFGAGSGANGRAIYERNFHLSWMYDPGQAKEYAARTRAAMRDDPATVLSIARYPNILLFDFSMQNALSKARDLRTLGSMQEYRDKLDPLSSEWGMKLETLGRSPKEITGEFEWKPLPGDDQHGGCIAGLDITSLLDAFAHIGVPQTVHRKPAATAVLEWHLSPHLGPLFELKTGVLPNWQALFSKALPILRTKLELGCRTGALVPCISDLLPLLDPNLQRADAEWSIRFRSRLGDEELRLEAIFLDRWFRQNEQDDRVIESAPATVLQEIQAWTRTLLAIVAGNGRHDDLGAGLTTAARFIAAHADPLHYRRRSLSRELADAGPDEIETAVRQNADTLTAFGLTTSKAIKALRESNGRSLELSEDAARACGVLDSIKTEAPTAQSARYAALALLVWGEMAWLGSIRGDLDGWLLDIERLSAGRTAVSKEIVKRLRQLSGIVVRDELVDRFLADLDDRPACSASAALLNRDAALFGAIGALVDFETQERIHARGPFANGRSMRPRPSQATEAKATFMRYLFAPAPKRLFLWQDAGTDIDKQLARLGSPEGSLKFSITAVLDRQRGADCGGLRPGEGALIRLFAAEFGFAERHWPRWMEEACKT